MKNIFKKNYVSVCSFFLTRDFPVLAYSYIHAQVLTDVLTEHATTVCLIFKFNRITTLVSLSFSKHAASSFSFISKINMRN